MEWQPRTGLGREIEVANLVSILLSVYESARKLTELINSPYQILQGYLLVTEGKLVLRP